MSTPQQGTGSMVLDCTLCYGTAAVGFGGAFWAQVAPAGSNFSATILSGLIGLAAIYLKGKLDSRVASLEAENRLLREQAIVRADKPAVINPP